MNSYVRVVAGLFALSVSTGDAEVKGARVSLVPKTAAVLNLMIENHRNSPMVEWQIGLFSHGGERRMTSFSNFSGRPSELQPRSGPIQPNERRTIEVELRSAPDVETAAMRLAVFEDGHYEGEADAVERWRTERQERVDDLDYWMRVLDQVPRDSELNGRSYLAARATERAGQVTRDSSGIGDKLQTVLRGSTSGPDVWRWLDRLLLDARTERALLTRQPSATETPRATRPVTSATIESQHRTGTTAYVASVENLRNMQIEAFGFELVDPVSGRPTSAQSHDFCLAEPEGRGDGRLAPYETRDFQLSATPDPNAPLPLIRFAFVLYDDLSFEGRAAERDELLRDREGRADDYAFALAALAKAAALPPDEAPAFLAAKRAERARQLQTAGRRGDLYTLDDLIRQANASPERIGQIAQSMHDVLERQRSRLLRHLTR
jgi:hypothetical protein